MRYLFCSALCFLISTGSSFSFERKFIGAHSYKVDGKIENGFIYSRLSYGSTREVKNHLKYLVGYLNDKSNGVDFTRAKVKLNKIVALDNEDETLFKVYYDASFEISWNQGLKLPESISLPLPKGGSLEFRQEFFDLYAGVCRKDKFPTPMSLKNFWYRIRKNKTGCELGQSLNYYDAAVVSKIRLEEAKETSQLKYPEYDKIWEDNKFVATMFFGKSKEEGIDSGDSGIRAYNRMYQGVLDTYGIPTSSNMPYGIGKPGVEYPYIELKFDHPNEPNKKIEIFLFLSGAIKKEGQIFKARFYEATLEADFVSYSGHAGLGGNIDVFGRIGAVSKNKYQIYFANGCTTYSYMKDILSRRVRAANNGQKASRFLDIITNATPSYFSKNDLNNLFFIRYLSFTETDYLTILQSLDYRQMAIVTGEEDNAWTPTRDTVID